MKSNLILNEFGKRVWKHKNRQINQNSIYCLTQSRK